MQRGLNSRDVPFGPDEGVARYRGLQGIQECAWSMHSVARVCVKAGVCVGRQEICYVYWVENEAGEAQQ